MNNNISNKIAIVTGASGGLGKSFVELLLSENINEIWCIARNQKKLEKLSKDFGSKIKIIPLDLSDPNSVLHIQSLLEKDKPVVSYLVNNAGVGEKLGSYKDFTLDIISNLISVNCTSVVSLCTVCIPYMKNTSRIVNIASQSAFQPVPYINLYASSKVFVHNYTRALNVELKDTGITATAVCSGWVETDMLADEINGVKVDYPGIVSTKLVAEKAFKDIKKGKDVSVCTLYVKYMRLLSKIFPQKTVMKTWVKSIQKYL